MAFAATSLFAFAQDYTQYVDPFIGTGGHGHVFLGANVPFGNIQAGPTQKKQGWDWCSGYHYSDSTVIGFGQMHLSGTGIGDLGDVSLLPTTNPAQLHHHGQRWRRPLRRALCSAKIYPWFGCRCQSPLRRSFDRSRRSTKPRSSLDCHRL